MITAHQIDNCNSCIEWHKHCNADCCRCFSIIDGCPRKVIRGTMFVYLRLDKDMLWYYQLHGCVVHPDGLAIPLHKFKVKHVDGKVQFWRNCDLLDGVLCKGHPDKKPLVCQNFNIDNCLDENVSPASNCLWVLKRKKDLDLTFPDKVLR